MMFSSTKANTNSLIVSVLVAGAPRSGLLAPVPFAVFSGLQVSDILAQSAAFFVARSPARFDIDTF